MARALWVIGHSFPTRWQMLETPSCTPRPHQSALYTGLSPEGKEQTGCESGLRNPAKSGVPAWRWLDRSWERAAAGEGLRHSGLGTLSLLAGWGGGWLKDSPHLPSPPSPPRWKFHPSPRMCVGESLSLTGHAACVGRWLRRKDNPVSNSSCFLSRRCPYQGSGPSGEAWLGL